MQGARDEAFDDDEGDDSQSMGGNDMPFGTREPQPFLPPNAQPFPQREQPSFNPRPQQQTAPEAGDVERLPSFITGGGQPQVQIPTQPNPSAHQSNGPNGHDNQPDRFPLHRRRRRHRGPRSDPGGSPQQGSSDRDDPND
jgi:hypothetical protein